MRRILRDYAAGKSPKRIATELNREGIPAPGGGPWGFSTINGSPKRGNGILNNEMYVGRIVWNRQRFVKDPDTGKRVSRLNPPEEWIATEVPGLRIVDDDLWNAVKERQQAVKKPRGANGEPAENHFRDRRRPKYLFSGLTRCGICGGAYILISANLIRCAAARNKGTCSNRVNIRREKLETRVLNALREQLVDPDLFADFCAEFTREVNRARIEARATLDAARREVERIDRELKRLLQHILDGAGEGRTIAARMRELETRQDELRALLARADEPPALLHPAMGADYRRQVAELHAALQEENEARRLEAAEVIRSLIDRIVLTPEGDELRIDLVGDLAGILTVAAATKRPGRAEASGRRNGRPSGAADLRDLASQVEVVAGAGFEPATFRL